ncbi:MAG: 6-carboxytetrahydropterin synthase [Dehalococcoidia bacterium]
MPSTDTVQGSYSLAIDEFFSARHATLTEGWEEHVHYHTWRIQALFMRSPAELKSTPVGLSALREIVQREAGRYSDTILNRLSPFDQIPPTAENLAATLYTSIKRSLQGLAGIRLKSVTLWVHPTLSVTYSEGDGEDVDRMRKEGDRREHAA